MRHAKENMAIRPCGMPMLILSAVS